jgi:PAS domain S-box-containing protein
MLKRFAAPLLAFLVAAGLYATGGLTQLEFELMDTRFDLIDRDASGELVVVAIDPSSLRRLDTWPWPRTHHATVIDRLNAAGARMIALDIDFSSRSVPENDAALADAIRRADGRVILPSFRQRIGTDDAAEIATTDPIPPIAAHARLASVNVRPEDDGLMRRAQAADDQGARRLPSMAALLAGREARGTDPFYIDYGILPDTIPALSFVDVLEGRFDPRLIEGKLVIVGATAVELGDKFAVPLYRSLPGVVVQVLAFESLLQDRSIARSGPLSALLVSLLLALALGALFRRCSWRWGAAAVGAVSLLAFAVPIAAQSVAPLSLDASPYILTAILCFAFHIVAQVESQARELLRQGFEVLTKGAMLHGIVADSFDGIVVSDEDGVVEIFNRAACEMLDYAAEEAIGRHVEDVLPLPFSLSALDAFEAGTTFELDVKRRGGDTITVELVTSSSVVRAGRARRKANETHRRILMFTFRDITDRKRMIEAQRQAMQEAMTANRAKSEFLTNMSHELRTPLNAIIGFSEMLKEQVLGPIGQERYLEYARDIFDSGSHLRAVVNDILDVSKVEAGKLELVESRTALADVVESAVRIVMHRADKGGIALAARDGGEWPTLLADERLVKQCLVNILSNAIKFTPEGGSVTVDVVKEDGGWIGLRIVDTGIGIPPDKIPNLGKPFYQVDSSLARTHDGTGLGLYLVDKFMTLHDGALGFESTQGKGTTVTMRFPPARVVELDRLPDARVA